MTRFGLKWVLHSRLTTCIAPVRDYAMTRDKAIEFAERENLPIDVNKKSPYSIDQNVWAALSKPASLEDIWNGPIETSTLHSQTLPTRSPLTRSSSLSEKVCQLHLDGKPVTMLEAIEALNVRAGAHGVGRIDMVEDRLVGIKSREVYEAPGRWR